MSSLFNPLRKFMNLYKKEPKFVPRKYVLFNVETFNTWFNSPHNNAVYANPGIFLRIDKLSTSHVEDYLIKCHNLTLKDWDIEDEIQDFYQRIREDWMRRINEK